ncbi:MAG: hypothetical protein CTY35_04075 [Methylotenera sp.]|nr:MAG: hypothetical protein CTY35_04075 [Methylotenera sp.]
MILLVIISVLIGLYIFADAIYLASVTDGENRYCMIAKYVGAAMSGAYLIFEAHDGVSILLGGTIALFMWPETYFRLMRFLSIEYPSTYHLLVSKFKYKSRRRIDNEATN